MDKTQFIFFSWEESKSVTGELYGFFFFFLSFINSHDVSHENALSLV